MPEAVSLPDLPVFEPIATKVQPLTAREFGIGRRRIPFDLLVTRPEHEGADVTLVDLDNFFSVNRRHRIESFLARIVEEQCAADDAEGRAR